MPDVADKPWHVEADSVVTYGAARSFTAGQRHQTHLPARHAGERQDPRCSP